MKTMTATMMATRTTEMSKGLLRGTEESGGMWFETGEFLILKT